MNSTHRSLVALVSLGFSLAGCKDKPPPQEATVAPDKPAPEPSASAVAIPAPSASAVEAPPAIRTGNGPKFIVRHKDSKGSNLTWLDGAVAICSDSSCTFDAEVVTEKGIVDTMNPTGFLEFKFPFLATKKGDISIRYAGVYPDICANYLHWVDRSDSTSFSLIRTGKTWALGDCPPQGSWEPEGPPPRPPRELDDALLHAPIADAAQTMIHGANSPPVLIAEETLYLWNGKSWSKHAAPWKKQQAYLVPHQYRISQRAVRLKNGSTFLPHGGYVIDPQGEIKSVQFISEKNPVPADSEVAGVYWAKKFPWLLVGTNDSVYLTTPDDSEKALFARAEIPGRTFAVKAPVPPPKPPTPAPSASAASSAVAMPEPALSASAIASADAAPLPPTEKGLGALEAFTSECTTPFVLLASPAKPGQVYTTTREGLKGHSELQDLVIFYELVIDGKTYFGAQSKNESDARLFMDVVEKSIKGMKPSLRCFDVTSRVPDRYAPPEGIRVIGINLTTGELIPFD
jgi:hypothetical protein